MIRLGRIAYGSASSLASLLILKSSLAISTMVVYNLLSQKQTVTLRHCYARLRLLFFTLDFPGHSLDSVLSREHEIRRIDCGVKYMPRVLRHMFFTLFQLSMLCPRLRARIFSSAIAWITAGILLLLDVVQCTACAGSTHADI